MAKRAKRSTQVVHPPSIIIRGDLLTPVPPLGPGVYPFDTFVAGKGPARVLTSGHHHGAMLVVIQHPPFHTVAQVERLRTGLGVVWPLLTW